MSQKEIKVAEAIQDDVNKGSGFAGLYLHGMR